MITHAAAMFLAPLPVINNLHGREFRLPPIIFMALIRILLLLGFAFPAFAGESDGAVLSRIDAYLNAYPRLQARFVQTAPDGGVSEGMLYLERPGKMRWEYAPPSPVLLVAEGGTAIFFDRELEQTSHFSTRDHWLGLLAREDIALAALPQLKAVAQEVGMIRLTLEQGEERLTMVFSAAPLELKTLDAVDATGQATTIALSSIEKPPAFADDFFTLRYRR